MAEHHPDASGGHEAEIRWLSYAEIAALRRISRASAERMARRARWRRQADNQGVVRVAVPLAYAEPLRMRPPGSPPDRPSDSPPDTNPETGEAAVLMAALDAVRAAHAGEIAALKAEASTRATAEAVTITTLAAERDAARLEAEQARAAAKAAEAEAEALRLAEAARRARGRLRRALAALRGNE